MTTITKLTPSAEGEPSKAAAWNYFKGRPPVMDGSVCQRPGQFNKMLKLRKYDLLMMFRFYHKVPLGDCVQQPFYSHTSTPEFEKPLKELGTLHLWLLTVWSFSDHQGRGNLFSFLPHSVTVSVWRRPAGRPLFPLRVCFFSVFLFGFMYIITDSLQCSNGNLIVSERANHSNGA